MKRLSSGFSALVLGLAIGSVSGLVTSAKHSPAVVGHWEPGLPQPSRADAWQARWIWADPAIRDEMILARKTFTLPAQPDSARIRISASTLYELYINGTYVGRGPARSVAHHQSFDDLEIKGLLTAGKNVIAVRVHYQPGTLSYGRESRGGLLAQLDVQLDDAMLTVSSDETWRMTGTARWARTFPVMSRFHLEAADRMDLRHYPDDWMSLEHDASGWSTAVGVRRETGWPQEPPDSIPTALVPPWTSLALRDIPYVEEESVAPVSLIAAQQIPAMEPSRLDSPDNPPRSVLQMSLAGSPDPDLAEATANWLRGEGPLTIPTAAAGQDWFLLFDLGKSYSGLPEIEIEAPAATWIDVLSAPYIVGDRFDAFMVDSYYVDRLILPGDLVRWRATYFKPVRYLGLRVHGAQGAVELSRFSVDALQYPFSTTGQFEAPQNPMLEALWHASAETIRVTTTDAYTDNYRERRQYVQTAYYAALGNYWTFGDTALHLRCLRQAADEQRADGWMPAYAPLSGDDDMVILDSNTAWVRGLREFYLYSGDEASVRGLLPAATKLMAWLHDFTDARGLIDRPPYPYWIDHAVLDRRGANFSINAHYLGALESFADILTWLGEPGADRFRARADQLRGSLRTLFWNSERGLFSDAFIGEEQSMLFTEQSNGLALAMGVATPAQAEAVAVNLLVEDDHNFARRANGMTMATPATSYLMFLGLCRYGFVEESLAEFQYRFARMLAPDTNQTLWEEYWRDGTGRSGEFVGGRTRSDAQTESAFAPALLGTHVLGLEPVAPGRQVVRLRWPNSGVPEASGIMPSPLGGLTVHWQNETRDLHVDVPAGMMVQLDLASLPAPATEPARINGQPVTPGDTTESFVTLNHGAHHVEF